MSKPKIRLSDIEPGDELVYCETYHEKHGEASLKKLFAKILIVNYLNKFISMKVIDRDIRISIPIEKFHENETIEYVDPYGNTCSVNFEAIEER